MKLRATKKLMDWMEHLGIPKAAAVGAGFISEDGTILERTLADFSAQIPDIDIATYLLNGDYAERVEAPNTIAGLYAMTRNANGGLSISDALNTIDQRIAADWSYGVTDTPSNTTQQLIDTLRQRDAAGRAKYGTSLDRTDLSADEWAQHMLEELLDAAGYLVRLRETRTQPPADGNTERTKRILGAAVDLVDAHDRWRGRDGVLPKDEALKRLITAVHSQ